MVDEIDIDVGSIRELSQRSDANSAVFKEFAARMKDQRETKVDRVLAKLAVKGLNVRRHEVVHLFKELEERGCGTFVIGRRGAPSRFKWNVSLRSIGQVATGEAEEVEEEVEADDTDDTDDLDSDSLVHFFRLRPDFQVEVSLPPDLTNAEAVRLANFIQTLPFSAD